MELKLAQFLAQEILDQLAPYCERIEVVGSIRRQVEQARDIDILLIPKNPGQLLVALQGMGTRRFGGQKLVERLYKGVQVDFYFATPETWFTLLLIRTGSTSHNIKLTSLAKQKGWHLYANGRGLFVGNAKIAGESEESFFRTLGLPYLPPERRM